MISLVTIAHNEAHRIRAHLDFAAPYCDELVVCVQDSTDGTADLVTDYGAKLVTDVCHGCSEPSRALAFEACANDWVMYLDADEHLDPERIPELAAIQALHYAARISVGAWIDGIRTDPILPSGKPHQNRQIRFFDRHKVTWGTTAHSRIEPAWYGGDHLFWSEGDPWVLNVKERWEQDLDEIRYARLST